MMADAGSPAQVLRKAEAAVEEVVSSRAIEPTAVPSSNTAHKDALVGHLNQTTTASENKCEHCRGKPISAVPKSKFTAFR